MYLSPTGLVTRRCYAATYEDCDGRAATREHWISRALLERIQGDGSGLRVGGLSWGAGRKDVSNAALASRMLCGRHNSMLHALDDAAIDLHDAWLAALLGHGTRRSLVGDDIERWALKVLVGMVASGGAHLDGRKVRALPDRPVLDALFGFRTLPSPLGFYLVKHSDTDDGLKISVERPPPGHEMAGRAFGITIQIVTFRFLTWLGSKPPQGANLVHRPAGLDFGPLGRIDFQWSQGASHPAERLRFRPTSESP